MRCWRPSRLAGHPVLLCVALVFALPVLGSRPSARADEGILLNGQRLRGELRREDSGDLVFQPEEGKPALRLEALDQVCFPAAASTFCSVPARFRVRLRDGEQLTGALRSLDADKLLLRTAWNDPLTVPRAALVAVEQPSGFVTLLVDDFEEERKDWRLTGGPTRSTREHLSGQRALCLKRGQQAEFPLSRPTAAGRAGINFRNGRAAPDLGWCWEAVFAGSAGSSTLRLAVAPGGKEYDAEMAGVSLGKWPWACPTDWQRLEMSFSPDQVILAVDQAVLCTYRPPASIGALQTVRLRCYGRGSRHGEEDGVFFDDFSLAQAVPMLPHPRGDPDQDELWLTSGDQLFGRVTHASLHGIVMQGPFGSRSHNWGEVRGIYFRQSRAPTGVRPGKRIRIWLRPGIGYEPDVLEGVIERLDAQELVLRHDQLGKLVLDRGRLERLRAPALGSR